MTALGPATPAFLDSARPDVPDIVVPRGVVPFHLENRSVRGRLVRLGPLADALLTRHENHPAVTALAGQALALVAALASALKFRGSFSLQVKGDGPVPMLLADCTDAGQLRGYARANADKLDAMLAERAEPGAPELLGEGYFALTVDQGPDTERHQGIVKIDGDDLAAMALNYFETSEQIECALQLACARTSQGWRAAALVLERVAAEGGVEPESADTDEAWRTATTLLGTLTDAELLDDELPAEDLLFRLFHTEGVAAGLPRALGYGCRCSRAKLSGILEGFSSLDLDDMVVGSAIVMTCEFCNLDFRFDRSELGRSEVGRSEAGPT